MNNAVTSAESHGAAATATSLDASDEFEQLPSLLHYCPSRLLAAFSLLMAGHGRCVNTAMMLGDHEYAMWQLARAHALDDPQLHQLAAQLFGYFDEMRSPVVTGFF